MKVKGNFMTTALEEKIRTLKNSDLPEFESRIELEVGNKIKFIVSWENLQELGVGALENLGSSMFMFASIAINNKKETLDIYKKINAIHLVNNKTSKTPSITKIGSSEIALIADFSEALDWSETDSPVQQIKNIAF